MSNNPYTRNGPDAESFVMIIVWAIGLVFGIFYLIYLGLVWVFKLLEDDDDNKTRNVDNITKKDYDGFTIKREQEEHERGMPLQESEYLW